MIELLKINQFRCFAPDKLFFIEEPDESIPQIYTYNKRHNVVLILIPPAFPHAATIPPGFVCANIFVKAAPPTVSTTPSQTPFSKVYFLHQILFYL